MPTPMRDAPALLRRLQDVAARGGSTAGIVCVVAAHDTKEQQKNEANAGTACARQAARIAPQEFT
jgi:hypothetical protein